MIEVTESAVIHRPPEEAFFIAADPEEQLKWDPDTLRSVEKLTPGPLGQGARYRGTFKGFGTVEYDFVEFDPPHGFAHHAVMKMGDMRHIFKLEPIPEGSRLSQIGRLQPSLLGRALAPLIKLQLRKRFRKIAAEIDQYAGGRGV